MPLLTPRLLLVSKSRLLLGLLATAAVLLAFGLFPSDARAADAPTETLELHPGDNFVGWVAEPIAVADIFKQISAATLIYTWNADSRTYRYAIRDIGGTLERLDPGMSARIRIEGRKTVKWERPLTPAKGMVTLYSGVNWVAWNGRDEWPLDQVARGIGTSLVSIEVEERGIAYQPSGNIAEAIEPLSGKSTLRRGDALRVTVNRDLRWLQPTGMMPNIEWVGTFSPNLMDDIITDTLRVLDFFAEEFAVETDFSETTVMVWNGVEAAVEHETAGKWPDFNIASPEHLRTKLQHDAGGWADSWGLVVAACWWDPPCPLPRGEHERGRDLMAHEWFHYLQLQISARHWWTVSPEWMLEGTAIWGGDRGVGVADGVTTIASDQLWRKREASRSSATLRSAEERNAPWQYHFGTLAVDVLVERSNHDAPIEYFRQLHPQAVGADRRWVNEPTWGEAFRLAFGIHADAFYGDFASWRNELPRASGVTPTEPRLQGTLHHSDGTPASGFWINAAAHHGERKAGRIRRNDVDPDGNFVIDLEANTVQRVWLTRGNCTLWLSMEGLTTSMPEPGQYRDLDTTSLQPLGLVLPSEGCQAEVQIVVESLRGDDRLIEAFLANDTNSYWASENRYGVLTATLPRIGEYTLTIRVGGCDLHYQEGRLVASQDEAQTIIVGEKPVMLGVRIPSDLCNLRVSGRLLDSEGMPLHDVYVFITGATGDGTRTGMYTGKEGTFSFEAPQSGRYALQYIEFETQCRGFYRVTGATTDYATADVLNVGSDDVTGIEFVVPSDPSSLCE